MFNAQRFPAAALPEEPDDDNAEQDDGYDDEFDIAPPTLARANTRRHPLGGDGSTARSRRAHTRTARNTRSGRGGRGGGRSGASQQLLQQTHAQGAPKKQRGASRSAFRSGQAEARPSYDGRPVRQKKSRSHTTPTSSSAAAAAAAAAASTPTALDSSVSRGITGLAKLTKAIHAQRVVLHGKMSATLVAEMRALRQDLTAHTTAIVQAIEELRMATARGGEDEGKGIALMDNYGQPLTDNEEEEEEEDEQEDEQEEEEEDEDYVDADDNEEDHGGTFDLGTL